MEIPAPSQLDREESKAVSGPCQNLLSTLNSKSSKISSLSTTTYLHPSLSQRAPQGGPPHEQVLGGVVTGGKVEEGDGKGEELAIVLPGHVQVALRVQPLHVELVKVSIFALVLSF